MKLSASMLGQVPAARSNRLSPAGVLVAKYARTFLAQAEPGMLVHTASGATHRVVSKRTSSDTTSLCIAHNGKQQTVSGPDLVKLGLLAPSTRRFVASVHRILAFDKTLDAYVKSAIEAAGLPVDHSMNWSKWLDRVYYRPLSNFTSDKEVIDDAIRDVVIRELYEKRILEKDSPGAHFNEDHPDLALKDLEKKVSAYLSYVFKQRVSEGVRLVRQAVGVGALGEVGQAPVESLIQQDSAGEEYDLSDNLSKDAPTEAEIQDDMGEIDGFMEAFQEYVDNKYRDATAKILGFITEKAIEGYSRLEIRRMLLKTDEFKAHDGKQVTVETAKYAISLWLKTLKTFVENPRNVWADTPLGQAILRLTRMKDKDSETQQDRKLIPTTASLVTADTKDPVMSPYFTTNDPVTMIDEASVKQAAVNPNVQQQQNLQEKQDNKPPTIVVENKSVGTPPKPDDDYQMSDSGEGEQSNGESSDGEPSDVNQGSSNSQQRTVRPDKLGANRNVSEEDMATATINRKEASKKLQERLSNARKERKQAATQESKYAKLHEIARQEPRELGLAFRQLSDQVHAVGRKILAATGLNMTELNKLRTSEDPKSRIAARSKVTGALAKIALEQPGTLESALGDAYRELDSAAESMEALAQNLGISLGAPEVEDMGMDLSLTDPIVDPLADPLAPLPVDDIVPEEAVVDVEEPVADIEVDEPDAGESVDAIVDEPEE